VPYPFQNNIRRLPREDLSRCLNGLIELYKNGSREPANFKDWILGTFGVGIAEVFLLPYNFKVWAFPPEEMNHTWIGDRVAVTDLARVLDNLIFERDDVSWGPNKVFQFPRYGGTGAIWRACASRLPQDRIRFGSRVQCIQPSAHYVKTADGQAWDYDVLISTIPLTELLLRSNMTEFFGTAQRGLKYSSSNIVGVGLKGTVPESLKTKCWMYFPEANCPFYRVTVFSNYSPDNVPDIDSTWSLMTETSESQCKPIDRQSLVAETIQGLRNTHLIESEHEVASTWMYRAKYGYPTPGLHRDEALKQILPALESDDIYSRGRFGAWKYEVSNQDHSFMQGVEIVERLLRGHREVTFSDPNHANSKKHPFPFERWLIESKSIQCAA
jgi:protoporphyrinogen oxidase